MMRFFKKNKLFTSLLLVVYLSVNSLFVLKYGKRQDFISVYLVLFFYLLLVFGSLYLLTLFKTQIDKINNFNSYFFGFCILLFLLLISVNIIIDGNDLNTDRWSAMDVTIRSVLANEYPYSVKDHLHQTSSNLPGLFYVGLPFYLLGDVGFLQPFCFLLMSIFLFRSKIRPHNKLLILLSFLMSPAYLWEIFGKSDLMSNLILLILFMLFWNHKFKGNYFSKPIILAFICAFFFLTRGIVVIPLVMFLFGPFVKLNFKVQLKFGLSFLAATLLISFPVLITIPDLDTLIQYNPLNHQTRYAPKALQVIFVGLPFFIALKIKDLKSVFKYTFVLFSLLLFITFGLNVVEEGFTNNLDGNLFDISYLGMIIPFIISVVYLKANSMNKKYYARIVN